MSVLVFYYCLSNDHKLRGLKQQQFINSKFCMSVLPQGHQAKVQVSGTLSSYLEVLGGNPLVSSLLLEEFSSLWLWDWGPCFLDGYQVGQHSFPRSYPHSLTHVPSIFNSVAVYQLCLGVLNLTYLSLTSRPRFLISFLFNCRSIELLWW